MILYYFDSGELGDSQRALLAQLERLDRSRYAARALLPQGSGELASTLRELGYDVDVLAMPKVGASNGAWARFKMAREVFGYWRKLFRYFQMYDFSVVHCDGVKASLLSVALKVRFNVPLLWQFHSILPQGPGLWLFKESAAVFCDQLLASSLYVAHQLGRSLKWRRKMTVVYRGYSIAKQQSEAVPAYEAERVVACSAEGASPTAIRSFARAVSVAAKQVTGLKGALLCSSEKVQATETLVSELGLETLIEVRTLRPASVSSGISQTMRELKPLALINASVEIAPFHSDVAEAMGAGVAVVASRTGVLAELISNGSSGLLSDAGNTEALAAAITQIATDEALRQKLVAEARREFEARFSTENIQALLDGLYSRYLKLQHQLPAQPNTESVESEVAA